MTKPKPKTRRFKAWAFIKNNKLEFAMPTKDDLLTCLMSGEAAKGQIKRVTLIVED